MKKFSVLPLAEKISEDNAYNHEVVKQGFKLNFPFWAYILYFAGMLFAFSRSLTAGICMFGAIFIIMPFDVKTNIKHNGHGVANNMWNRIPFIIIGSTILIFNIACQFAEKEKTETGTDYLFTETSIIIIKVYIAALAALMVGRLIYLIVIAFAIAARKKVCTAPVSIEYENDMLMSDICVFRYYYEGETYRFIDHEEQVRIVYNPIQKKHIFNLDQVYIDPNCPESYYSRQIFGYNSRRIKNYFKTFFFFLLVTSIIWLPYIIKYFIDHLYN